MPDTKNTATFDLDPPNRANWGNWSRQENLLVPMWLSIWKVAAAEAKNHSLRGVGVIYFAGGYFISSAREDLDDTRELIRLGKKKAYSSFNEAAQTAEKEWIKLISEKRLLWARSRNVAVEQDTKN